MVTRTARLKDFRNDGYPGSGLQVQVMAKDHVGIYILPFPCERINGEWRNATTGEAVQACYAYCSVKKVSRTLPFSPIQAHEAVGLVGLLVLQVGVTHDHHPDR